jgi:hypothetical protein
MTRDGLSQEAADKLVREKNQQREQYVKRNFGRALLAPEHYHIMLNTAWLGIDRCVTLVVELARERLGARRTPPL